ncbi:hypothetical protein [Nocardioides sp. dk884]|uniref:hypothetical protein n=1 Tax=Nocardioides sp. dk884 TaxID=2662361 RepID=UPI001E546AF4|nr:hypothetical protein [Nocardioides sp. dk884]
MSLLDRHLSFLEALRGAGLPVSLAEDLDAVAALTAVTWEDRALVREAYAATLVKRRAQRPTFDTVFDLWFPRLVGEGYAGDAGADADGPHADEASTGQVRDGAAALESLRERLVDALAGAEDATAAEAAAELAVEAIGTFGRLPGAGRGAPGWSAYAALQRVAPERLVERLVRALLAGGATRSARSARPPAASAPSPRPRRPRRGGVPPRRRGPPTSRAPLCGPPSTSSTSSPPGAPTSTSCAARCTRWRAGSPPG